MATAVQARDVSKRYLLGEQAPVYGTLRDAVSSWARSRGRPERREVWALRDLDLEVGEGELLGIIGRNGAGKSTLLKLVSRITRPSEGVVRTRGRVGTLLDIGTGFHPELTGRENIFLNGAVLGMRRRTVQERFDAIVDFSGVHPDFLDTPLKRYSAGMRLRLAFAVAAHLEADILVVDEVLAIGDAEFRQRCTEAMSDLTRQGRTVLFVSHDLGSVGELCKRAIWLERGELVADGPAGEVIEAYGRSQIHRPAAFASEPSEGAVGILDARLVGEEGSPLQAQPREDPLRLSVRLRIHQHVPGTRPAVAVTDRRGITVINESWDLHNPGPAFEGPGDYELRFTLKPILAPGSYVVRFWVGTAYEDFLHTDLFSFEVAPSLSQRDDRSDRPRLIDAPDAAWSVEPLS